MLNNQTSFEQELVSRLVRGDAKAQYTLYKRYVDAMYHTVIRIVKDPTDAQDVVQECFIRVFQKIDTYRGEATLGAWIKRIAIHSAFNLMRKRKRNLEYATDEIERYDIEFEIEDSDSTYSPENVHHAIKELPTGCRAVVSLYALEGYSHKEIAGILDITESTSKTQYRRAKGLLKDVLVSKMRRDEV